MKATETVAATGEDSARSAWSVSDAGSPEADDGVSKAHPQQGEAEQQLLLTLARRKEARGSARPEDRDCLISGWLLKQGVRLPSRWNERYFVVDHTFRGTSDTLCLRYYSWDPSLSALKLRGEAELRGIRDESPRPLAAFELGQVQLAPAGNTQSTIIVRIDGRREREVWLRVGRALSDGLGASLQAGLELNVANDPPAAMDSGKLENDSSRASGAPAGKRRGVRGGFWLSCGCASRAADDVDGFDDIEPIRAASTTAVDVAEPTATDPARQAAAVR
eukprot:4416234-Prymnesium_polylepis.1